MPLLFLRRNSPCDETMGPTHDRGTLIDTCRTPPSEFGDVASAERWLSHLLRFPTEEDFDT